MYKEGKTLYIQYSKYCSPVVISLEVAWMALFVSRPLLAKALFYQGKKPRGQFWAMMRKRESVRVFLSARHHHYTQVSSLCSYAALSLSLSLTKGGLERRPHFRESFVCVIVCVRVGFVVRGSRTSSSSSSVRESPNFSLCVRVNVFWKSGGNTT